LQTPPPIKSRDTARTALWVNLLVLPGLGLWFIGQRALAVLHIAMSASGVVMSIGWMIWFLWRWIATGQMPDPLGRHLLVGLVGLGLFGTAWLWAGAVSLAYLRRLPAGPVPPPLEGTRRAQVGQRT
jgi:hypothetical protein